MRTTLLTLAALLPAAAAVEAQTGTPLPDVHSSDVHWFHIPALFPKGARMALISGDPIKPGMLVALISMPDGYTMAPHAHTSDEHVEVKQGTFLVGVGDKLDVRKTMAMTVGDTATAPAGVHHFAIAKGPTIVLVTSMAPYVVNYANTREEPWRPFPYGY
jgi:quercetin dioxygenase-like cupin family protein